MRDSQLATLTVAPNVTATKQRLGNVEIVPKGCSNEAGTVTWLSRMP